MPDPLFFQTSSIVSGLIVASFVIIDGLFCRICKIASVNCKLLFGRANLINLQPNF